MNEHFDRIHTIGRNDMVTDTGKHPDSPLPRYADGKNSSGLPLPSLAGIDRLVIRAEGRRITRDYLEGA